MVERYFETVQISNFSPHFHPLILATIDDFFFCLQQLLVGCLQNGTLDVHHSLYIYELGFGKAVCSSPIGLFIQLFFISV